MELTINTQLVIFILAILGCVVLIFLIIVLKRLASLLQGIESIITQNTTNIGLTIAKLPVIFDNVDKISDNVKDVSDVAVDVSADVLEVKNKVKGGVNTSVDVFRIVKDVFKK